MSLLPSLDRAGAFLNAEALALNYQEEEEAIRQPLKLVALNGATLPPQRPTGPEDATAPHLRLAALNGEILPQPDQVESNKYKGQVVMERLAAETDAATQFAEAVDGNMRTRFKLRLVGNDLYDEHGRSLDEMTAKALAKAERKAASDPRWSFEVHRRTLNREEFYIAVQMAKGVGPNSMFVPSDFPEHLRNAQKSVAGYNLKRQQAMAQWWFADKEKPGELFYDNALMGIQLMEAARQNKVKKFVTIGTVCAYPKHAHIPFNEEDLWNGYPEEVTAAYGLAKKMLLVQGIAYKDQYKFKSIFLIPVNLYGPGDHFDSKYSHVMPALIKRIVDAKKSNAKKIVVWGSGKATREFLFVDDAARAVVLATKKYDKIEPVNIGSSREVPVRDLVKTICDIVGYKGKIVWDKSKPDGVMRRKISVDRAEKEFGFKSSVNLDEGIKRTVDWYMSSRK